MNSENESSTAANQRKTTLFQRLKSTSSKVIDSVKKGKSNEAKEDAGQTTPTIRTDGSHFYSTSLNLTSSPPSSSSSSSSAAMSKVSSQPTLLLDLDEEENKRNADLINTTMTNTNNAAQTQLADDLGLLLDLNIKESNHQMLNAALSSHGGAAADDSNDYLLLSLDDPTTAAKTAEDSFDPLGSFEVNSNPYKEATANINILPRQSSKSKLNTQLSSSKSTETPPTKSPTMNDSIFNNLSAANRPNYFLSSEFSPNSLTNTVNNNNNNNWSTANHLNKKTNVFDDFLPDQFKATNAAAAAAKANLTLKDLKHDQLVKETDPDTLKILEWTDGKKANIRALLCSLHKVLWEGETRWNQVGMHQLVSADDVKKMHKKAVLVVHPDKLTGHPQLNLARLILVELNEAWAKFSNESQQNLF